MNMRPQTRSRRFQPGRITINDPMELQARMNSQLSQRTREDALATMPKRSTGGAMAPSGEIGAPSGSSQVECVLKREQTSSSTSSARSSASSPAARHLPSGLPNSVLDAPSDSAQAEVDAQEPEGQLSPEETALREMRKLAITSVGIGILIGFAAFSIGVLVTDLAGEQKES